ncbi:hypothetical protein HJC05_20115 [Rhizobium sp. NLR9a]|uniref:hypothetical protein n=1 Tax=unclassified Rhizobium TaxID=2613769 RepID=UPI001C83AD82|nr:MULTISPECIES: hypothetical protein [unclassified Rhizobium]MBX5216496.1 hypothetical protein [Rhizobium sp. NLR9a]MBX5277822.1 hypothetical protein [Rhizobium sp. NLR13a]
MERVASPLSSVLDARIARAARAYTKLSHKNLGSAAGVATRTIVKLEKKGRIDAACLERIMGVFARRGIVFLYDRRGVVVGMKFTL